MRFEMIKVSDIVLADYNPRVHLTPNDLEYKEIKKSIEQNGYIEPIVVNEVNMHCVDGEQRLSVLKDLGVDAIMASVVHIEDIEQEKKLNIGLSRIDGRDDEAKLNDLLSDGSISEFLITFDAKMPEEFSDGDFGFNDDEPEEAEVDFGEYEDEIESSDVMVKIGNNHFMITKQEYDDLINSIRDNGHFTKEEVVDEFRRRLMKND